MRAQDRARLEVDLVAVDGNLQGMRERAVSVLSPSEIRRRDQTFSRMIRERASGRCQRCGVAHGLHCAHVVGRARWRLRWHPDNGVALCWRCHSWAHGHPLEAREWFASLLGPERWQALQDLRRPARRREVVEVVVPDSYPEWANATLPPEQRSQWWSTPGLPGSDDEPW